MTDTADVFNLQRFVEAQGSVIEQVRSELQAGRKQSHWMWFIFPQLKGLGNSVMANTYAINSREEAESYMAHPVLGPRLLECCRLINAVDGRSITAILGTPDDLKFRSCITLFAVVAPEHKVFKQALNKYFKGETDENTVGRL